MNFIEQLNYNTTNVNTLKYDALSFLKVVENYFNFTPDMAARTEHVFKETWNAKPNLYHNIRYENVILGIALYVMDEFYDMIETDRKMQSNSMAKFVGYMYGSNSKNNIIQIYRVRDLIKDIINTNHTC